MNMSLLLLLYASIGFVEWALALLRTIFTIKHDREGKPYQVGVIASTVMLETFVGMLVFANFANTGDWLIAGAYAFGSAIGSYLPLKFTKRQAKSCNRKVEASNAE